MGRSSKVRKIISEHKNLKALIDEYGISVRELLESSEENKREVFGKNYEEFKRLTLSQPEDKPAIPPEPESPEPESPTPEAPEPIGDVDENGVQRLQLPAGMRYTNESYKPKENFRDDGSRLDFNDRVRKSACIGGYLKSSTSLDDEEFAGKLLGTHSSGGNNSGCYCVGISVNGKKARLRKEIHNDYSKTIKGAENLLGDLRNKWIGLQYLKINQNDKTVLIQAYVDTDPFNVDGTPKNQWEKVYEIIDDGKLKDDDGKSKYPEIWLEPSLKGKSQYSLRIDKDEDKDKDNVEYKHVFCREIINEDSIPESPPELPGPEPEPPKSEPLPGDVDEHGIRMLHKITGEFVDMEVGKDHRNGQRYNVNHHYQNYMIIGYFKTGRGQEVIELKGDGPNHSGCEGGDECCWVEADLKLSNGQFYVSSEYPHPKNHEPPKNISSAKTLNKSLEQKWIGYAAVYYDSGDGFRRVEEWCDPDPFDSNGKPNNGWVKGLDEVDRGQITTEKLAKRKIPINFNKGLEAEIRMHGATNHDCQMKHCRVYEIVI